MVTLNYVMVSVLYRSRTQFLQILATNSIYAWFVSVLYRSRTQFLHASMRTACPQCEFQSSIARGRNFYLSVGVMAKSSAEVSVLYRSRTQFLHPVRGSSHPARNVSVLYRSRTQFLLVGGDGGPGPPVRFSPLSLEDAISTGDYGAYPAGPGVFQSSIARGRNFYTSRTRRRRRCSCVSVLYRSRTQFLLRAQIVKEEGEKRFSPLSLEDAISTASSTAFLHWFGCFVKIPLRVSDAV